MKTDKLEEFIQNERSKFDANSTPDFIWKSVERELDKAEHKSDSKIFPFRFMLSIAAGAAVLICVGFLLGTQLSKGSPEQILANHHPEYLEAESHYQHQVNLKWNEVKKIGGDKYVQNDISQLDAVYQELKTELMSSGVKDEGLIVEAMIEHYQTKLNVLEIVLQKLNQSDKLIYNEEF